MIKTKPYSNFIDCDSVDVVNDNIIRELLSRTDKLSEVILENLKLKIENSKLKDRLSYFIDDFACEEE